MVIAIDFDGTCVTHDYPYLGSDVGAVPVLKELVAAGHKLILSTMRSGKLEQAAKEWFEKNNIPLYAVNKNPDQSSWTQSTKIYAELYIDDAALGCPTKTTPTCNRPFADWEKIREILVDNGYI